MNWHLIEIKINPPDQLEFDFMDSGYTVWSAGNTVYPLSIKSNSN